MKPRPFFFYGFGVVMDLGAFGFRLEMLQIRFVVCADSIGGLLVTDAKPSFIHLKRKHVYTSGLDLD